MSYINDIYALPAFDNNFQKSLQLSIELESGITDSITVSDIENTDLLLKLINDSIKPELMGYNVLNQVSLDKVIKALPTTVKKEIPSKLLLSLSMLVSISAAHFLKIDHFKYLNGIKEYQFPQVIVKSKDSELYFFSQSTLKKLSKVEVNSLKKLNNLKLDSIKTISYLLSQKADILDLSNMDKSFMNTICSLNLQYVIIDNNKQLNDLIKLMTIYM